jgi:hypothetical protein
MRFLPCFVRSFCISFSFCISADAVAAASACVPGCVAPAAHAATCLPLRMTQDEPDGWLLLAGLVVCMAGRLAARPRR